MNLQSKKARIPIAALGVTALVCGAGALASPAFAATSLTLLPGATTATVTDLDPSASLTNAALGYGVAFDGDSSTATKPLSVAVTGPTGGSVLLERVSGSGAPTRTAPGAAQVTTASNGIGDTVLTMATTPVGIGVGDILKIGTGGSAEYGVVSAFTANTSVTLTRGLLIGHASGTSVQDLGATAYTPIAVGATGVVPKYTTADSIYVGSAFPGTYTVQFFQDNNNNGSYDSGTDYAAPAVTLNVDDVNATTATTSDDLSYSVTAPSSLGVGTPLTSSTTLGGLTTTDFRGSPSSVGVLGTKLASAVTFTDTSSGGSTFPGPTTTSTGSPTFDGTKFSYTTGNVSGAGSVTSTATIGSVGTASAQTTVADNTVTGVAVAATPVTGSVVADGTVAHQIDVLTGTGTATYTATATKAAGATPVAGVTVNFTVTGTAAELATVTTDGTTVDTSSTTSHVYSAVTDSTGVATLKVTSGTTTAGTTYGVNASSNGQSGTALTALYQNSAPSTIAVTSTSADLTPAATTGASATIKGKVTDQYGSAYTGTAGTQQAQIYIGTTGTTCSAYSFGAGQLTTAATANVPLSSGTFSYTYMPTTTPAAGSCTPFGIGYDANNNGTIVASEGAVGMVNWGSTAVAASVKLTAPADGATGVTLQTNAAPTAHQSNTGTPVFGNTTGAVTGTVYDATNAPLAYKAVTLSGGTGVMFATSATPNATNMLAKTLDVVTNSSGQITGAYVFFTDAGAHNVIATSGSATATSTVTAPTVTSAGNATTDYAISVDDVTGDPGSTVIVTGKVSDLFGNPVANAAVSLSTGTSTIGVLGNYSPTTNSEGVWSTTFTSGSNQSGDVTLTATLNDGQTANATPVTAYATAGLTGLPTGQYQDTGKITVANLNLTLTASSKLTSAYNGAVAKLSGSFAPNTSVNIMIKPSGEDSYKLADSVTTNDAGDYTDSIRITKSTYFLAQANGMSSKSDQTVLNSSVSLTAKALGKGKVSLHANGDPNSKAALTFYRSVSGPDIRLKTVTSSSVGTGTVTVSLPKGTRSVYVTYKATGTGAASSKTMKVKVK